MMAVNIQSEERRQMIYQSTDIPDVTLVTLPAEHDSVGLLEVLDLQMSARFPRFVQDNKSFSKQRHTLRGMHYQRPPHAQAKLVRCAQGEILDVVVDIRAGSPTYGKHHSVVLSAENRLRMFVPVGFLHGFLTLVDDTIVEYMCSDIYAPDCDGSVHWSSLGIGWGDIDPLVSDKDAVAVRFESFVSPFKFGSNS